MGSFKPMIVVLIVLFLIGAFLNLFIAPYVDTSSYTANGLLTIFIDFFGMQWVQYIPFFGNLLSSMGSFISLQLIYLSFLPDIVSIPLIVIMVISVVFSITSVIKGG